MLKKIGVGAVVLVVGLLGVIATRPSTFEVKRSQKIAADPAAVFAFVSDFRQWPKWSPWEGLDPAMSTSYSGAESGKGAIYEWSGNDDVGTGRMEITAAQSPSSVTIDLEFMEPWPSTAETIFTLSPEGEGTTVTWSMAGENDFMGKAMSLFMDMDAMLGGDFEKGLAALGKAAEVGQVAETGES
jgi:uncharacterized protein YndB with AHSA1/START domain